MGEVLLQRAADRRGIDVSVGSAGVRGIVGAPASDGSARQMRRRGLDLSSHAARQLDLTMVRGSDLILTMEASHVVDLVVAIDDAAERAAAFERAFTIKEFVARASAVGPRGATPFEDYLDLVGRGRSQREVMGMTGSDVADPIGRPDRHYRRCADELDALVDTSAELLWGT